MRRDIPLAALLLAVGAVAAPAQSIDATVARAVARVHAATAYQGRDRGPDQNERFSRKVKIGRDGRVSVQNISGDIIVTGGSGDEVSIEAVKHTRGDRSQLNAVQITVDERPGRVDIRTDYERGMRSNNTSVDFTVTVPSGASVDVKSVSGNVKITSVQGLVHAESVSGSITTTGTPKLEAAKSVSGDVTLNDAGADADLSASSVSGSLHARGLKARSLDIGTVSGDVILTDVSCERFGIKSVSGNVEYSGTLARSGRYDVNAHSGNIRLTLTNNVGFELNANSFSGSIRSELPLTIGGDPNAGRDNRMHRGPENRTMHATYGDGSASLTLRTFSGDIVLLRK